MDKYLKIHESLRKFSAKNKLNENKDKIESIIYANGLDHTDIEWDDQGRMTPNSSKDVTISIYTDERTFQAIVGDLESSGVELLDFDYNRNKNYGWISPRM